MRAALTPCAIAWHREHASIWSRRAAELRASGGQANLNRAMALDSVVAGLRARLPANPVISAKTSDAVAFSHLESRLAACAPSLYPGTNIMTGVGPIMDGVRQRLRERIAALKGEPAPNAATETPAAIILPPAEAMPFVAGPQLELFGMAS